MSIQQKRKIFTSYENELAEIESSNKSTVQKEKDKIALNQELLIKIENELKATNEQKRITPDQLEQLNEREANLIVLKEKIEGRDSTKRTKSLMEQWQAQTAPLRQLRV
jgi:hypothetical protein